jgi:ABC-2 type transport system permease protein
VLVIVVMFFSPINYPASHLPGWLVAHRVLPLQALAKLIRGGLTGAPMSAEAGAFGLAALWCGAALGVCALVAHRRT